MRADWMNVAGASLSVVCLIACAGCPEAKDRKGGDAKAPDKAADAKGAKKDDGHDHGHAHAANVADVGPFEVTLEVHAAEGEIDLVFEDAKTHKPAGLKVTGFTAQVKLDGGAFAEAAFAPADAKERKDDKPGEGSRFSAKVAGVDKAKKVYLAAKLKIDGKDETLEFKDVDPAAAKHDHKH